MSEPRHNIEEHELYKLSSDKIKPEDLEAVLEQINNSGQEEWLKLHCASRAYLHTGQYEKAIEIIDSSLLSKIPEEERWRAQFNRASCLNNLERYEEAMEVCCALGNGVPDDKKYLVWNIRGVIYFNCKQYSLAIPYFIAALINNPPAENVENARVLLANCYYWLNQYQKAIEAFNNVLRNNPPADKLWRCYDDQAYCHFCLGRYQEAIEVMEKALNANPPKDEFGRIFVNLAMCYQELGRFISAINVRSHALVLNPPNDSIFSLYVLQAECYFELRAYQQGVYVLQTCDGVAKYPPSDNEKSRWKFWMGRCLLALGRIEEARECFAESDETGSDFFRQLCDEVIEKGGMIDNKILTMRL